MNVSSESCFVEKCIKKGGQLIIRGQFVDAILISAYSMKTTKVCIASDKK